jgi:hypothetical protein
MINGVAYEHSEAVEAGKRRAASSYSLHHSQPLDESDSPAFERSIHHPIVELRAERAVAGIKSLRTTEEVIAVIVAISQ